MLEQLRRWDLATASGVTHFVAISETIRERIAQCYQRESHVIQPPVNVNFYSPIPRVPRTECYLVVSALVPYKRIDQAVAACTRSGRRLIVIGEGPGAGPAGSHGRSNGPFPGLAARQVIGDHYRSCRALLFPGEEDFGIVPIEALACGAPVIALGRGGVAETVDNTVGRTYAEPTSAALLAAIDAWESDGCPHDSTQGRRRAEALSQPVFRERMLEFLAEVMTAAASTRSRPHRI